MLGEFDRIAWWTCAILEHVHVLWSIIRSYQPFQIWLILTIYQLIAPKLAVRIRRCQTFQVKLKPDLLSIGPQRESFVMFILRLIVVYRYARMTTDTNLQRSNMQSVATFGFSIDVEGIILPRYNVIQLSIHTRAKFVCYDISIIFETSMKHIRILCGYLIFFNWTFRL